jgi:protein TonB
MSAVQIRRDDMDLDAWQEQPKDSQRFKRMALGWGLGAVVILSTGAVLATSARAEFEPPPEEAILDVQLVDRIEPEEPEPEPEAHPEPTPEPEPSVPRPPSPAMPKLVVPTEIPSQAPGEAEPKADTNPYGAAFDPYQYAAIGPRSAPGVTAPKEVASTKPAAPAPRAPSGPVRVSAETNPPVEIQRGVTAYPAAAKAAGVEGVVVVKFVVSVSGEPTDIQAVSGPEELREACEAKVRGSKYQPATSKASGLAVAVIKNTRCVFQLKTN